MKGYKCDRCGEFFEDAAVDPYGGDFKTIDKEGKLTLHLPERQCKVDVDLCSECVRKMWAWIQGYEKPEKDFEEKYQDTIIRLDKLDEISSAAFTVNCHIKYFKDKIAEKNYEGAVLEADGLVRYTEELVQTVKASVQ